MVNDVANRSERALRGILIIDLLFQVFLWGLPSLASSAVLAFLANFWNVTLPKELIYVRALGAFSLGFGYLLFATVRRPTHNVDIYRFAVVTHVLVASAIVYSLFSQGVTGYLSIPFQSTVFWWITILLNSSFAIAILFAAPRPGDRALPDHRPAGSNIV